MITEYQVTTYTTERSTLPYAVYLPEGYETETDKEWPLVIFLHGAGERGNDLQAVYRHGPLREVREGRAFPFIVIAPQIEAPHYWACYAETLNTMLDDWLNTYRIDKTRVYLTGLSMGGTGTWMWGMMNPERFAAIMPICGTGICWCAGNLQNVPVWVFHGDADTTVPITESYSMVERLNAHGADVTLTVYEGYGHDSWTDTYRREDVYEWLLSHTK